MYSNYVSKPHSFGRLLQWFPANTNRNIRTSYSDRHGRATNPNTSPNLNPDRD